MGLDDHVHQAQPAFLLLVSALLIVLHGGGESAIQGSQFPKIKQNNTNPILALRFTTKILLPGWDLTISFIRDELAFLPLLAALAVVLEGGEGDCNPGS